MKMVTREGNFVLVSSGDYYFIGEAIDEGGDILIDDSRPAVFRSWKDVVGIMAATALAVLSSTELKAAAIALLGEDLSSFPDWLVRIGITPLEVANAAWYDRADKHYPEFSTQATVWDKIQVSDTQLFRKGEGFVLLQNDSSPKLSASSVMELAALVLSDGRTSTNCPEQYSPFLASMLSHHPHQTVDVSQVQQSLLPATIEPSWTPPVRSKEEGQKVSVLPEFNAGFQRIREKYGF